MTLDIERTWAIVTGASEGIGEVFAQHLDQRQTHNVILVARTKAKLDKVAAGLVNVKSLVLVEDLSAPGSAERIVERTKDLRVSLLINNAGMAPGGNHEEIDFATIQRTIALNITVLTELMSLYLPIIKAEHEKLREQSKGTKYGLSGIINVSSMSAFTPIPSMALYSATKAYVLFLSESVYQEQRNIGCDLPIVCTLPGPCASEIWTKEGANKGGVLIPLDTCDHVVQATLSALDANRPLIIPGYLNNVAAFTTRFGPRSLVRFLSRRLMGQDQSLRDSKEVQDTFTKLRASKQQQK
ncbi:hypothetical protein CBS101457_000668 [Exobasidium rhododendri]|nr:hypothetical protein CBS101457_000668 [Exobasidium rhododendri]